MSSWAAPAINTLALARVEALMLLGRQPSTVDGPRFESRSDFLIFLSNAKKIEQGESGKVDEFWQFGVSTNGRAASIGRFFMQKCV